MFKSVTLSLLCVVLIAGLMYQSQSSPFSVLKMDSNLSISTVSKTPLEFAEANKQTRIGEIWKQEFERTKDPATNTVPRERLAAARRVMYQKFAQKDAIPNVEWTELGPNNVGGRTRAVLFDRQDNTNNTVYAAGVAGGLWRTTNFKTGNPTTWTKINDFFDNLAICSMVQDPNDANRLVFGTGEGWSNVDAVRGAGVYEYFISTDMVNQLENTNNSTFFYVQDLVFDDEGNLYAATRSGLQRTENNGTNWEQVLSGRIADLEKGADGDLYATIGIFSTGSIHHSDYATHTTDVGESENWTDITPTGDFRRIEIANAPSDEDVIYAICQGGDNNEIESVFSSTDKGANWTTRTVPSMCDRGTLTKLTREGDFGQAWYDLIAVVDPTDATRLYAGGVDAARSDDSGQSWTQISSWTGGASAGANGNCDTDADYVHADLHAMVFEPGSATNLLIGSDGGIDFTTNATAASPNWTTKNTDYNITQFYACAIHPTADNHLAGAQDNGTRRFFDSDAVGIATQATGGDGAFCHIDANEPQFQFTQFTRNTVSRSTNGGQSFRFFFQQDGGSFINPSDYDDDLNHLYLSNTTGTYRRILNAPTAVDVDDVITVDGLDGGVTALLADPTADDRLWLGTWGSAKLVRVDNASAADPTETVMNTGLPSFGTVSSIAISELSPQRMLLTLSNYGVNSVWESTDGGMNWSSVEGNLPDMPVRWGMFSPANPDQALLATELGVWSTDNLDGGNTDWDPTNVDLANVRTDMLQYRNQDNLVLAATHGRGMFATDDFQTLAVNFASSASAVTEATTDTDNANCDQNHVGIEIPVFITLNPTTSVNVTASIKNSSTASAQDYDLANSSLSLTFTNGGTLNQSFFLRIADDAIIENAETIELELSIDNPASGAAVGAESEHTLTINDNEVEPLTSAPAIFYTEDWTEIDADWQVSYPLVNDPQNEDYNGWFVGNLAGCGDRIFTTPAATILDRCLGSCGNIFCDYWDYGYAADAIIFRAVDATNLSGMKANFDWIAGGNANDFGSLVYSTDNGTTWQSLATYNNQPTTIQNASVDLPAALEGTTFLLGWRWQDNGDDTRTQPGFTFDNITLEQAVEKTVSNTLNDSETTYLKAGETAHFYDGNNNIIASVTQNSGADIGCITASVETTGTGRVFSNNINGFVTERTINFSAANNAPYTLKLYFTQAELADWAADIQNLNILKSTTTIANANQGNSQILANADLNVATFENLVIYEGDFSSFSSFTLTEQTSSDALPIELLAWQGKATKAGHVLSWQTTNEQDNAYFTVEHSSDGQQFNSIGTVKGSGTNTTQNDYEWLHTAFVTGTNYYRLRQVDLSGKTTLSEVITIEEKDLSNQLIYPNPANDQLFLQLAQTAIAPADLRIFNALGQVVWQNQTVAKNYQIEIQSWTSGVYFLQAADGTTTSFVVQH